VELAKPRPNRSDSKPKHERYYQYETNNGPTSAGLASGFLALTLCTKPLHAESPVREVTLAYEFDIDPVNPWHGLAH